MNEIFRKIAHRISVAVGSSWAFILALLFVFVWTVTGPYFHYSNSWQLIINTGTTILTFLMVFVIQNTQNRDSQAFHLKLDELIRSSAPARESFIDLEDMSDEKLSQLEDEFKKLREVPQHKRKEHYQKIHTKK